MDTLTFSAKHKFIEKFFLVGQNKEKLIITGKPTTGMVKLKFSYNPKKQRENAKETAFFYFNSGDGKQS